jgi:AAA+ ATPase superfamily predicted ATPase
MPSPFLHGNPVPPEHFVGRRRELARILDRLASRGQSTAVLGEPRAGKTSLLEYLASVLRHSDRDHVILSYLDSHTLDHGLDHAAFWERAFEPIDAEDSPLPADAPARKALDALRDSGFQTRKIKSLLTLLNAASIRVVLLIDEFDYLVQHCVQNPRVFFGSLRSITTLSRGALALVLASRRSLAFLEEIAQGAGYTGSP